jgi:hypothetical protein
MYAGDDGEGSSAGSTVLGQARKKSAKGTRRGTKGSGRIMGSPVGGWRAGLPF